MTTTTEHDRLVRRLGALHDRVRQIAEPGARAALVEGWVWRGDLIPEKERLIEEGERILDRLLGAMGFTVVGAFAGDEPRAEKVETVDEACSLADDMHARGASSVVIIDPDRQPWSLENLREVRAEEELLRRAQEGP
jgi:hypothetical protein